MSEQQAVELSHQKGNNNAKKRMWNSSREFVNGIKTQIQQSYGCSQIPIRKNVLMIDDDRLIYQCGKHLVEYDLLHKKQNYILKNIEDEDITAINYVISSSEVLSVVIAMKGSKGFPQVNNSFNFVCLLCWLVG